MKNRKYKYLVGDFETTVYDGQDKTEVWASAIVELYTEDVKIFHSIAETFDYLKSLKTNVCLYYHNLKFDGSFWLQYLINDLGYLQAYKALNEDKTEFSWAKDSQMPNYSVKYSISEMGQ